MGSPYIYVLDVPQFLSKRGLRRAYFTGAEPDHPRQSAGSDDRFSQRLSRRRLTFETMSLEGRLTFGDRFHDSGMALSGAGRLLRRPQPNRRVSVCVCVCVCQHLELVHLPPRPATHQRPNRDWGLRYTGNPNPNPLFAGRQVKERSYPESCSLAPQFYE